MLFLLCTIKVPSFYYLKLSYYCFVSPLDLILLSSILSLALLDDEEPMLNEGILESILAKQTESVCFNLLFDQTLMSYVHLKEFLILAYFIRNYWFARWTISKAYLCLDQMYSLNYFSFKHCYVFVMHYLQCFYK